MSQLPRFSISPAVSNGPAPVTLTMSPGYVASAGLTNQCGLPIGSVTTTGLTATPVLPPHYSGTFFVTWKIAPKGAPTGLHMSMTLAARETTGHATTCAKSSPYTATTTAPLQSHALVVKPAAATSPLNGIVGGVFLLLVLAALVVAVRRVRRRRRA